MLRRMAACCICWANFGKCSLIWMPGTEVAIGLNSPASLVPGFMSNVSFWLGPPSIQSRMHDLCLTPEPAAWAAIRSNQPDIEVRAAPAAANLSQSRRDRSAPGELLIRRLPPEVLMIQGKLTAIEQGPEDIAVSLRSSALVVLEVFLQASGLDRCGTSGQGRQEEPLDVFGRRLAGLDCLVDERLGPGRPAGVHQPEDLGDAGRVLVGVGSHAGTEEVHKCGARPGCRVLAL